MNRQFTPRIKKWRIHKSSKLITIFVERNQKPLYFSFEMYKNKKQTMTKLETSTKVSGFIGKYTYDEVAKKLDMTRTTLYARLLKHNWKMGEIELVKKLN